MNEERQKALLTDEEMFYIGMDITKGGGDYAGIMEVIKASAQVQLDKAWDIAREDLVDWLENFVKMSIFYGDWGGKAQQYGQMIVKACKAKLKE